MASDFIAEPPREYFVKIIIVGAGQVGFNVASRLATENKEVVVVDRDAAALKLVSEQLDVQTVEGSGSSPAVLQEAGVQAADILLAVTDSDETNLVSCLFADMLSPATKKLVRLRNDDYTNFENNLKERPPHIDTIINPELELVRTVQRLLDVPGAVDVAEFADGRLKLIGVRLGPGSPLAGKHLWELPRKTGGYGFLIAAIVREEELIIPTGRDVLKAGDLVYFVTEQNRVFEALSLFDIKAETVRRALVVGGGRIGFRLAKALEEKNIYTKIIEKDPRRANELAENLNRVIVLQGDGSDQSLLSEENVQDMDVVITVTSDEETNILISLLARRMGVGKAITLINRFAYLPLVAAIGIEHVISPRLSAVNTILQHVRRGNVLTSVSLKGEQAEAMEAVAMETSDVVGKPLKNIDFPKGALVMAIFRGQEVIIPSGDSVIHPMDRIVILSTQKAISKVEKALAVKLEFF